MRFIKLISIYLLLFQACSDNIMPKLGEYRAEIITKDNSILPFKFKLVEKSNKLVVVVENDKETLIYDDIIFDGDSIKILMPPYDAVIIAKVDNESLYGRYLKEESGKEAPFFATINNESKFHSDIKANFSLSGKYKTVFRPGKILSWTRCIYPKW